MADTSEKTAQNKVAISEQASDSGITLRMLTQSRAFFSCLVLHAPLTDLTPLCFQESSAVVGWEKSNNAKYYH